METVARSNPKTNSTLKIDITGAAICLAITALGYFALVDPLFDARAARQLEHVELVARQERLAKQTAIVSSLSHDLSQLKRAAAGTPALTALPAQQSNQRLADLTHLAAKSNLNVDELRTAASVNADRFQIVPIHLAGTGAFRDCTAFLHQLRTAFPDTAVSALRISKPLDMPADRATFRFQLSWYAAPTVVETASAVKAPMNGDGQ